MYYDWNRAVFMSQRKCSSDDAERTDGGRVFHARAAVQLIIRPTHKPCYAPSRKFPFINPE